LTKVATGLISAMVAASQATHPGAPAAPAKTEKPHAQIVPPSRISVVRTLVGNASWYGPGFRGRRTASGEIFNPSRSTIASRHLPFGTRVRVTFLRTGRSAEARVTDRGPFVHGRIIDCSEGLAKRIGLHGAGHGRVKVDILAPKSRLAR
jgi:rare lipoprotein A